MLVPYAASEMFELVDRVEQYPNFLPWCAGAQVLDLTGKFIIPGLFDSHVHWDPFMGELLVNHGVTSILALDIGSATR